MNRAILFIVLIFIIGCGRKHGETAASLDALLATSHVNRVEFLNYEKDKTNVFTEEKAEWLLKLLHATNRADRSIGGRIKSEGVVLLFENTNYVGGFQFIPEYDALSFAGKYYFGTKGTNRLQDLFE